MCVPRAVYFAMNRIRTGLVPKNSMGDKLTGLGQLYPDPLVVPCAGPFLFDASGRPIHSCFWQYYLRILISIGEMDNKKWNLTTAHNLHIVDVWRYRTCDGGRALRAVRKRFL